jgi:hypothetical protein
MMTRHSGLPGWELAVSAVLSSKGFGSGVFILFAGGGTSSLITLGRKGGLVH